MFTASDHTFVICAYKENPFLEETILSLKSQTVKGYILLSTSTPSAYLEDLCVKYDINMVINPHPGYAGDDWNYGYDAASTPLVTIAHQDDYYEPDFLESNINAINRYLPEETAIVFSDYYELRNNSKVSDNLLLRIKRIMNLPFRARVLNKSRFVKRRVLSLGNPICCPAIMYVKSVIGDTVFDTTYKNSCDYKTLVDLASQHGRFIYIPKRLVGHRIYEESATSRNIGENIRKKEDEQILALLWPKQIARLVNSIYSKSESSNEL